MSPECSKQIAGGERVMCHISRVSNVSYIESAQWLNRATFIYSGVGINKNYTFHNFKFHVCLRSSGE